MGRWLFPFIRLFIWTWNPCMNNFVFDSFATWLTYHPLSRAKGWSVLVNSLPSLVFSSHRKPNYSESITGRWQSFSRRRRTWKSLLTKECFSYLAKNKSRNFPLAWLTSSIFKRICFSPLLEQKWAHQKFPMLIQQIRNSFWLYACALDEQVQWFQDKNNHEYAMPRLHFWLYWSRKWENPKVNGLSALDHTHAFFCVKWSHKNCRQRLYKQLFY